MHQTDIQQWDYEVEADLLSDAGCCRQANQDLISYLKPADHAVLKEKGVLAIVADGMGGHQGGQLASQLAVDAIQKRYYARPREHPPRSLKKAFAEANSFVYQRSLESHALHGMGTTASALVVKDRQIYFAHVGDSRIYRQRDGELARLTEDHTVVMEMVHRGLLTPEQARMHPDRYIITRALGTHPEVEIFAPKAALAVHSGDCYVLCTDGLHDLVTDDEIEAIVASRSPHEACTELTTLAKRRGGPDNISVGVLAVRAVGKTSRPAHDTRT
ncbi:MAG: Stp1/IreP family PP2C-type Ser/Thr phosphatase [Gammaproteobacteria bacterium]